MKKTFYTAKEFNALLKEKEAADQKVTELTAEVTDLKSKLEGEDPDVDEGDPEAKSENEKALEAKVADLESKLAAAGDPKPSGDESDDPNQPDAEKNKEFVSAHQKRLMEEAEENDFSEEGENE